LKETGPENFQARAMEVFCHQAENNQLYKNYVEALGIVPDKVSQLEEIPFLPISFFKNHLIKTGEWQPESTFLSSGTTDTQLSSRHLVRKMDDYLWVSQQIFQDFYGNPDDFHILALLPSYLDRQGSSLVKMVDHWIQSGGSHYSGFFNKDHDELAKRLKIITATKQKALLIGVSFALLDFSEKYALDLQNVIIMETGGMKGRRKEMIRHELHELLRSRFGTNRVHSEYGMTELFSQAYTVSNDRFSPPSWMKILVRETNDPFSFCSPGDTGVLNIIDLANLHTCSFIATDDLGKGYADGTFEVLGRMDNSDIRGCNLMIQ